MTFLQPYILWALPLILLPVLIHLFNRLRHRSIPWAAMMFLRSATRKSTRYARLRQFLILLFRVLAVLVLLLAISRPLAGGWMGWMISAAPDAIIILFDRSASMQSRSGPGAQATKREEALQLLTQSARGFEKTSRVILIDSFLRQPQEVPPAALPEIPLTAATDTAADIPALMQTALDWLAQNKPGSAEIWIASDFQASNWNADGDRWASLASALAAFPQAVRVRLLGMNREPEANSAIAIRDAAPRRQEGHFELDLTFDLERSAAMPTTLPVTVVLNGSRTQIEVKMEGQSLRYRHRLPLGPEMASGWGYLELPADANEADNRSYFVYGPPPSLKAALVANDAVSIPYLQLATAPDPRNTNQSCEVISPRRIEQVNWLDYALVLWQQAPPTGAVAAALDSYVAAGGVLVCFPPGAPAAGAVSWGQITTASPDEPFRVTHWNQTDGPLANTDEGLLLPLAETRVLKRQTIAGEHAILGAFADGPPFLLRESRGSGQVLYCATLPNPEWSDLGDGAILVPMLQRCFQYGARRLREGAFLTAGQSATTLSVAGAVVVDSTQAKQLQTDAGVYRAGATLIAVNRPAREDDRERVDPAKVRALFGSAPVRLFEEQRTRSTQLQSELWRLFLFGMAVFLLVEAVLILPERTSKLSNAGDGSEPGAAGGSDRGRRAGELTEVVR